MCAKCRLKSVYVSPPHLFHFLHIRDLLRELPVLHELKVVGLELVLEGGHVVRVLLAVLRQCGDLAPSQTFHRLNVSKLVLLVLCYRPEEVGILLAVTVGDGALGTVAYDDRSEVLRNASNGLHSVGASRA